MARYTVHLTTTASAAVYVEVDDDLDPAEQREAAIEAAYEGTPNSLCAQCAGWGNDYSVELGDGWELSDYEPVQKQDG